MVDVRIVNAEIGCRDRAVTIVVVAHGAVHEIVRLDAKIARNVQEHRGHGSAKDAIHDNERIAACTGKHARIHGEVMNARGWIA
jgi:hypothetical protein